MSVTPSGSGKGGKIRAVGRFLAREGGYLVGATVISGWVRSTVRLFLLRRRRRCPKCASGLMFRFNEIIEGECQEFYGCSVCDHFEPLDVEADEESLASLQALAKTRLAELTPEQRGNAERTYRFHSRVCLLASLVMLGVGFWGVFEASALTMLNSAAGAGLFFIQGIRASYRHWQLMTGTFYQPGAFKLWFATGTWII